MKQCVLSHARDDAGPARVSSWRIQTGSLHRPLRSPAHLQGFAVVTAVTGAAAPGEIRPRTRGSNRHDNVSQTHRWCPQEEECHGSNTSYVLAAACHSVSRLCLRVCMYVCVCLCMHANEIAGSRGAGGQWVFEGEQMKQSEARSFTLTPAASAAITSEPMMV